MGTIIGLFVGFVLCLISGAVNGRNIAEMLNIAIKLYVISLLIAAVIIAPLAIYVTYYAR